MKKTDVLVIGSSAAGLVAATTGKRIYKDKKVTVVTKMPDTLIPCGIPYIFGSVGTSDKNLIPVAKMFEGAGIDMIVDEVLSIDREAKTATLANEESISYEKLVIGTGSSPIFPKWLTSDKKNVFTVPKIKGYLDSMQEKLENAKKIIVVGAGFIGVEISDELTKAGKEVILVEKLDHILSLAFDIDISERAEVLLKERGVNLRTGKGIKEIIGNGSVEGVVLEDGEKIDADAVILAMGYSPNVQLAKDADLAISDLGFIKVDEYMRTADSNVFAVGDCAEKRDFVTRKSCPIMLASTACAEARIAGMNLFKLSAIKTFSGTISIFSTALGNT
ncbi:MAG: FAD-dependent oxidoreductase, partial [Bacteroidales bacterium]|nr:FAD-dependent oxidoreductase [Bacteroidales bacterium]